MYPKFNLKAIIKNEKFLIYFLSLLLIVTITITTYVGYNEYSYRKIGICFTENNYNRAEQYLGSMSPRYKDVEKIKSLIHTVKNFDQTNINDYNRVISLLDSYKGFSDINVNYFYNNYYHDVLKLYKSSSIPAQENNIPTTAFTSIPSESTSAVTFPYENTTVPLTTSKVQVTTSVQNTDTLIVYYVESGEVYHINRNCRSIASSSNVKTGPIPEGRRVCKVCGEG